ncbi:hypothetical protein PVK06_046586 [Gossypium arboreum]|uniref:Uncharacterized protein n=1 Tax=Gossypium arboreum TaxID=29729 RepID=A0ABR0MB22_GOSAR|nr:hypothetical protein PVK06_046586 [Gossypium arboreum]
MGDSKEPKPVTTLGNRSTETSALISRGPQPQKPRARNDSGLTRPWCNHCNRVDDVLDVRLTKTQLETLHKILGTSTTYGSLATQAVPIASPTEDCSETEVSPPSPSIYLPIAVRTGTRSCTQHPISQFVSYGNLSKSYKSFVTNIDSAKTPKNIEDALESAE